jgi:hypothetical protein
MVKENVFKFDPKPITMLKASTFQFIKDLKANNNKEWFDANRKIYQIAKDDFLNQKSPLPNSTPKNASSALTGTRAFQQTNHLTKPIWVPGSVQGPKAYKKPGIISMLKMAGVSWQEACTCLKQKP